MDDTTDNLSLAGTQPPVQLDDDSETAARGVTKQGVVSALLCALL